MEITPIAVVSFAVEKSVAFSTVHRATIAYWFALVNSVVATTVGSWTRSVTMRNPCESCLPLPRCVKCRSVKALAAGSPFASML